MAATLLPFQPAPAPVPDPASQAVLAELMQLGLSVARLAARAAEMEVAALAVLQEDAVATYRAGLARHASLEERNDAANRADASEAARDVVLGRATALTSNFERAARAIRRTAALKARLAAGRLPRPAPLAREAQAGPFAPPHRAAAPRAGHSPANDAERGDSADSDWAADWADEIAGQTDGAVLQAIRRDLAAVLPEPGCAQAAPAGAATADGPAMAPVPQSSAPPIPPEPAWVPRPDH